MPEVPPAQPGSPSMAGLSDAPTVVPLVAGMSRGGTTWMVKTLSQHPDAVGWGESLFWGRGWIDPGPDGRLTAEQRDQHVARLRNTLTDLIDAHQRGAEAWRDMKMGEWPREVLDRAIECVNDAAGDLSDTPTPAEVFIALNGAIARAWGVPVAVESTPHHVAHADRIFDAMPGARMLVMWREPGPFLLSYKHQGDRMEPDARRTFRRLYHPISAALVWKRSSRSARSARERHPDRVMLATLDALRDEPERWFTDIQRFFGLREVSIDPSSATRNSSFKGDHARPRLRADDAVWMRIIAGPEIRAAGHAAPRSDDGPLAAGWRLIVSLCRLPVVAFWTIVILRSRVSGGLLGYLKGYLRR